MNCESLLKTLRPHLETVGHLVIAGGAVRDELMGRKPKDWDVFVLGQKDNQNFVEQVASVLSDLYVYEDAEGSDPGPPTLTLNLEGEKVQVIPSPCDSLSELIDTFDWNICLFGHDTGPLKHEQSMLPTENCSFPLKLHTVTHPLSTLRRGFQFCDRYQMFIEKSDIRRLCSEVLAQIITQEEEQEPEEAAIELA